MNWRRWRPKLCIPSAMALGNHPSFRVVKCSLHSTIRLIHNSCLQLLRSKSRANKTRLYILYFACLRDPWVALCPMYVAENDWGCEVHTNSRPACRLHKDLPKEQFRRVLFSSQGLQSHTSQVTPCRHLVGCTPHIAMSPLSSERIYDTRIIIQWTKHAKAT